MKDQPLSPEEVRAWLLQKSGGQREERPASPKQVGLAAHLLESVWPEDSGAARNRRTVLKWLFRRDSLKALTRSEIGAVIEWLTPGKDEETGQYILNPTAAEEARLILRRALEDAGQMWLF